VLLLLLFEGTTASHIADIYFTDIISPPPATGYVLMAAAY